jgi:CheY-like chemotaxis protein
MSMPAHDERPRVLIVDDEKFIRDILADFLGMEGYIVRTAEDGAAALTELNNAHYDLVISDLKMPRMGGIELLDAIGSAAPNALTVIMTGFGTVETAIDAMKRGRTITSSSRSRSKRSSVSCSGASTSSDWRQRTCGLREALSLYKVSEAIAASLSLEEVLATVGDTALHELNGDLVSTWLDNGEGGYFERQRLVQTRPVDSSPSSPVRASARLSAPPPIDEGPAAAAFGELVPEAFVRHYAAHSTLLEQGHQGCALLRESLRQAARVAGLGPPADEDALLGWISVASFTKQKRFNEGHRKLLSIVGSRAAAAIENARLYEDLRATFQQTIEGLRAPSTRWTATPRATRSGWRPTRRTSPCAWVFPRTRSRSCGRARSCTTSARSAAS